MEFDKKFESFLDTLNFSFSPLTEKEEIDEKYNDFLERIKERYCYTGFIGDYKALEKNHTISDYENWKDSKDFENFVLTFNLSEIAFEEVFKEKKYNSIDNSDFMNNLLKKYEINENIEEGEKMLEQITDTWNRAQEQKAWNEYKDFKPQIDKLYNYYFEKSPYVDQVPLTKKERETFIFSDIVNNLLVKEDDNIILYKAPLDKKELLKIDLNTNELFVEGVSEKGEDEEEDDDEEEE